MKRVSFDVAKAIKEAGYPQEWYDCEYYYTQNGDVKRCDDYLGNTVEDISYHQRYCIPAPTYIEVWLWLWREKNIRFDIEDLWDAELSYPERGCASNTNQLGGICTPEVSDPEEAIEKAIAYLCENGLIK